MSLQSVRLSTSTNGFVLQELSFPRISHVQNIHQTNLCLSFSPQFLLQHTMSSACISRDTKFLPTRTTYTSLPSEHSVCILSMAHLITATLSFYYNLRLPTLAFQLQPQFTHSRCSLIFSPPSFELRTPGSDCWCRGAACL